MRQRGLNLIYMREITTYACYTSRQIPLRSVHVTSCYLSQCLMTSSNTECTNTQLVSYKLRSWSAWRPATKSFSCQEFDCWPQTLQHYLRPSSVAFFILLLVSSLTYPSQLSFLYILIGTFAFLPSPPSPPLISVSGQLGLRGACAVAVGRLGQCVAIHLLLLSCVCCRTWSLRAGGARE